jgi:hypothetical protein
LSFGNRPVYIPALVFVRPLILACCLLALGAVQASASGVLSSFALTPSSTQAGANPDVRADLTFSYADGTDSVRSVTIDLAPGLIASIADVPETCSPDQLRANACPAGSQIGTGSVTTNVTPRAATLYLMPPPTPGDGAGFGTVVLVGGTPYTSMGTLDVVSVGGQPVGEVKLGVPVVSGQQVMELHATMQATTADGRQFTRMPTSCATASSSASVETEEADTGAGADSFLPTGCAALGYAPALSAVQAVKDSGDDGVELLATLSQPNAMAESATTALRLHWPASLLPDAGPDGACLIGSPCTIGTASATSPLAPPSYLSSGTVTLGGTPQAPTLNVAFPPPIPLSLTGAIDLAAGTVTFSNLPDLPLSALTIDVTGPAGAKALVTTCAAGELAATFTPQSGGATVTSTHAIAYQGCPPPRPSPSTPQPLRVSIRSRRALVVDGHTAAKLACNGGVADSICRGRLSLTVRKRIVRRVHGHRSVRHRTIAVARARYAVASGQTRAVTLPLTDAGLRLLAHSRRHRVRVRATATLNGGTTAHRTLVLRLAPTSPASR